jgi:hypothetical protein
LFTYRSENRPQKADDWEATRELGDDGSGDFRRRFSFGNGSGGDGDGRGVHLQAVACREELRRGGSSSAQAGPAARF